MNTKQKIGRACMIVGILLILGALALLGYNQWDANRADQASQDALGKLEETLTETIEDKTKDEEPVVQPELDPEQEMTVTDIDGWGYIGYLSILSIGLELPVMSEWSYAGLKVAPGRYSGSTYADNMVVCATTTPSTSAPSSGWPWAARCTLPTWTASAGAMRCPTWRPSSPRISTR